MSGGKDSFCWFCHQPECEVSCLKCELSFHHQCGKSRDEFIVENFLGQYQFTKPCNMCSRIRKSLRLHRGKAKNVCSISKEQLNLLFDAILSRGVGVQPSPAVMFTKFEEGRFENVYHFINLEMVKFKVKNNSYLCTEGLLSDLQKIEHVMIIGFGKTNETEAIAQYIDQIHRNLREIDLCPHCVHNDYLVPRGRIKPCPWGHRPVLIDQSNNSGPINNDFNTKELEKLPKIFPGKILAYHAPHVLVRLFGSGKPWSIKVFVENVYHLNHINFKQCEAQLCSLPSMKDRKYLEDALEEVKLHLEELRIQFNDWLFTAEERCNWRLRDGFFIKRPIEVNSRTSPPAMNEMQDTVGPLIGGFLEPDCLIRVPSYHRSSVIINSKKRSSESDSESSMRKLSKNDTENNVGPQMNGETIMKFQEIGANHRIFNPVIPRNLNQFPVQSSNEGPLNFKLNPENSHNGNYYASTNISDIPPVNIDQDSHDEDEPVVLNSCSAKKNKVSSKNSHSNYARMRPGACPSATLYRNHPTASNATNLSFAEGQKVNQPLTRAPVRMQPSVHNTTCLQCEVLMQEIFNVRQKMELIRQILFPNVGQ